MRVDRQAEPLQGRQRVGLGRGRPRPFPARHRVEEGGEPPLRRDPRVEEAERPGRGVPRVREERLPRLLARAVERLERLLGEIDLSADLDQPGNPRSRQLHGQRPDRPDVGRDVLARRPVAPRGRADELPFLVDERHREPVDLQLADDVRDAAVQPLDHPLEPGVHVLRRIAVLEREERHLVPDLRQLGDRRPPDALGRRVGRHQLRVLLLQRDQLADHRVVLGVGELGPVVDVVELPGAPDLGDEIGVALAGRDGHHPVILASGWPGSSPSGGSDPPSPGAMDRRGRRYRPP